MKNKQTITQPNTYPTAHLCINKSRIKVYNKESFPTYYLSSGTEFSIELANPTNDVVLAKIILNGKAISQGGLVLNPGQRVYLDRYLDVAKKFLFDTYEVSNSTEIKKAIEHNGDIKVEFYREQVPSPTYYGSTFTLGNNYFNNGLGNYNIGTPAQFLRGSITAIGTGAHTLTGSNAGITNTSSSLSSQGVNAVNTSYSADLNSPVMDSLSDATLDMPEPILKKSRMRTASLSKKSIETGRVEEGGYSDQKFKYVNKNFEYFAFHTVEYKMLPVSQKVNTAEDINVKRYCTQCGAKVGKTDNFCSSCGKKA